MILNKPQAEAIASAMCALNNIGARIDVFSQGAFHAREMPGGQVVIHQVQPAGFPYLTSNEPEIYENQNAFFAAYGID